MRKTGVTESEHSFVWMVLLNTSPQVNTARFGWMVLLNTSPQVNTALCGVVLNTSPQVNTALCGWCC